MMMITVKKFTYKIHNCCDVWVGCQNTMSVNNTEDVSGLCYVRIRRQFIHSTDYYLSLDQGDKNQIQPGEISYNILKHGDYQVKTLTGANFDVPLIQLSSQIDDWVKNGFISADDAKLEKIALQSDQAQNVFKEVMFNRGQTELAYGINGFIKLSENTGMNIFTFFTFRLNVHAFGRRRKRNASLVALEGLSQLSKFKDFDWATVIGSTLTRAVALELDNIMAYIKHRALQNLYDQQEYYLNLDQGDKDQIKEGEILYNSLKYGGYILDPITGAVFDVPLMRLSEIIDEWVAGGVLGSFISADDAKLEKIALQSDESQHVIKEVLFHRGQMEMVYGINGFIKLSKHTGASIFTFYSFRLHSFASGRRHKRHAPRSVWESLSHLSKFKDFNWNKTIGGALSMTDAQKMDNMLAYVRHEALQILYGQQGHFLNNLLKEEEECREFLPHSAKKVNLRIETYNHLPVNQIFSHYPFTRPPY